MCLIVVAWRCRDDLPLLVAANRDEWRDRPSRPAHWWEDHPQVLAGRDLKAGGTWMGVTRGGRFASVTNFRDPAEKRSTAASRGGLVTEFLLGEASAEAFLRGVAARRADYNGFNLILGDATELWYYGSRENRARPIEPGVHGLSNHLLDEPWPKVVRGRAVMAAAMRQGDPETPLFAMLGSTQAADDAALPDTGVGLAWERRLASALITGEDYGTRCSTVIAFERGGQVRFEERTLAPDGSVTGTYRFAFATSAASSSPVL